MSATTKALSRRLRDPNFAEKYFVGDGIDIGSGPDPLAAQIAHWPKMRSCESWDLEQGDAQYMHGVEANRYDFVYSSHMLEDLVWPQYALERWREIVKPGGYLVLLVPDEDLYEQGVWPPTFNQCHKVTFTICKGTELRWSEASLNLAPLLASFGEIIKLERIEDGYDFTATQRYDQTGGPAESSIECIVRKPFHRR